MPIEAEVDVDPKVARDAPSTMEPEIRDDASALVLVETAPPSDQGGEGVLPVVEIASPLDKGKEVATSRGEWDVRSTYGRKHVGQRPSKGLLSRLSERSGGDPTN